MHNFYCYCCDCYNERRIISDYFQTKDYNRIVSERIKITETSGAHNFNIDEFGVYTETPLNKESVVMFTADKSGSFVYYCSKPGHRQNGHWGTLTVL